MDSMYNNMPENLGTEACKEYLESRTFLGDGNDVSTNSILTALNLCLKNNYFCINEKVYKQIHGVGTGIKLAPTYACLGLGKYERNVFSSDQPLLRNIVLWKRFIDDVLMLFRGTKEECELLVTWLNSLMPGSIRFKYEFSYEKIEFLDLEIYLKDGKLKTNMFVKPTNKQLYLDFNSSHPEHCKESIPFSQALRIIERCSTPEDANQHLAQLKSKLEERNYPPELVEKKFEKAKLKDRKTLIYQPRKQKTKSDDKVRLIITHSQANPPMHKWIRESKKLLARNDEAKALGNKIQIGSKQPKNLQRIAGGLKSGSGGVETPPPDAGCKKCGRCKVSCPILKEGKIFSSTNTGKKYKIRQKLTCDSDWLIYLATCRRCKGQYVGKSKTIF